MSAERLERLWQQDTAHREICLSDCNRVHTERLDVLQSAGASELMAVVERYGVDLYTASEHNCGPGRGIRIGRGAWLVSYGGGHQLAVFLDEVE
jgi:hypothetical protein